MVVFCRVPASDFLVELSASFISSRLITRLVVLVLLFDLQQLS